MPRFRTCGLPGDELKDHVLISPADPLVVCRVILIVKDLRQLQDLKEYSLNICRLKTVLIQLVSSIRQHDK